MTMVDVLLGSLFRAQIAAGFAIVLMLVLRRPARALVGAELAYRLWAVVPVAALVSLFPTLPEFLAGWSIGRTDDFTHLPPAIPHSTAWLTAWLAGGAAMAGLMIFSEARFRRLARAGRAGPAVMGVSWPRIVTPSDYAARFTKAERDLIERHERVHIARRHPSANLFIAIMQALGWFNPLVHVAAACARLDQELACDAAVVQATPECRRDYGATLLKAHLATPRSPLACAWFARGRHPLEVRLTMLARRPISLAHYLRGAAAVALITLVVAMGVWSVAPRVSAGEPGFRWTTIRVDPSL